jgi:hypothetical protein
MLAVAGGVARFHVDVAGLRANVPAKAWRYEWTVAAEGPVSALPTDGPPFTFAARMPDRPGPVTVTVTVSSDERPVAFGTLTFVPLTEEAALKAEVTALLREMVMPGEPSNPLVHPTAEPASRTWILQSTRGVRLPWIEERATRLAEAVRRLRALGRDPTGGAGPPGQTRHT